MRTRSRSRKIVMIGITILLLGALLTGAAQVLEAQSAPAETQANLENVRDYAPASSRDVPSYAVDAGVLFAGGPGAWTEIATPNDVIVNAVAFDHQRPNIVYIGAANELSIYRSIDAGQTWERVPLSDTPGGVTDIAVDSFQRLVYAGTDNAGVFRLRDVGTSMVVGGQLLVDEPVRQVATDSTGAALAFARTDNALYRADNFGLAWTTVDNLHSSPTAIAIAEDIAATGSATIYVGTTDRGVLVSQDGRTWDRVNEGLGMLPGTRLHVDALAVDPMNPEQLYAATSYLHGSTTVHQTASHVAVSADGAATWSQLDQTFDTTVAELLPVSGMPGAVYALTIQSRTPLALHDAPTVAVSSDAATASVAATTASGMPAIPVAWVIAALAALALGLFVAYDLKQQGVRPLSNSLPLTAMDTQTVSTVS